MMQCHLVSNGRRLETVALPAIPARGDVIANADPKLPYYLVHRVELFVGSSDATVHVQEFANQLSAVIDIDGFRNQRGWL